jgi:flavorubredoxin
LIRPAKKACRHFWLYGGLGGAPKRLAEDVSAYGFEVIQEAETYFVPTENELVKYYKLGVQLASRIKS